MENDRKKFKRMESEYNQFVKEKQALKKEKMGLRYLGACLFPHFSSATFTNTFMTEHTKIC